MIVLLLFLIGMTTLAAVAAFCEERLGWGLDEPDFPTWADEVDRERSWEDRP